MRYVSYLVGQPVSFLISSRSDAQQVAQRLRAEVRSRFWPFHFEKVVGRVGAKRLSIEWRGGLFARNMAPQLHGRLVSRGTETRFDGRFGAPVFLRFFLAIWISFDAMFFVLASTGNVQSGNAPDWMIFPFLLVHLLFPFGLSALGMIGADTIKQRLIDFVVEVGSGERARHPVGTTI